MMWSAYGMPISSNAATYGEAPSSLSFQGTMMTSRIIDPTKNVATRKITDWVAFAIARSGSLDSAAATVAISAPTIENTTTTMLEKIALTPLGKKPPWLVRLLTSNDWSGHRPRTKSVPRHEERDDGEDLDAGEPVLELAVRADREQVGGGHQHHQHEREDPQRCVDPERQDLRRRRRPRSRRRSPRSTSRARPRRSPPSRRARGARSRRRSRSRGCAVAISPSIRITRMISTPVIR